MWLWRKLAGEILASFLHIQSCSQEQSAQCETDLPTKESIIRRAWRTEKKTKNRKRKVYEEVSISSPPCAAYVNACDTIYKIIELSSFSCSFFPFSVFISCARCSWRRSLRFFRRLRCSRRRRSAARARRRRGRVLAPFRGVPWRF